MPEYPRGRYNQYGGYVAICPSCGRDEVSTCLHCLFPQFTPLGGMHMLARGLLEHYEIDSAQFPAVVAELEQIIGEELLDIGREVLEEKGLLKALAPQ